LTLTEPDVARWFCVLSCLLTGASAWAQTPRAPDAAKEAVVRFGPVPDIIYEQVPAVQRGQGVVVEELADGTALARHGVRKYDILVSLDGTPIKSADHLTQLLGGVKADASRRLSLVRGGKRVSVLVNTASLEPVAFPKALLKAGGPPMVGVEYQPTGPGKLKVVITYNNNGKLVDVTCTGSLTEIEARVRQLGDEGVPPPVQELADAAIKRIRARNADQQP
jgi:hypothetical protein